MRIKFSISLIVFVILASVTFAQTNFNPLVKIIQLPNLVSSVAWSHDGRKIAVGGEGYVWIYSFDGEILSTLITNSGHTTVLRWSNQDDMLVSSSRSTQTQRGKTIIWDTENYEIISSRNRLWSVAIDYVWILNNQYLLGGTGSGDIFIIDPYNAQLRQRHKIISNNFNVPNIFIHGFCQSNELHIIFAITTNGIYSINVDTLSYEVINSQVGSSGDCSPSGILFSSPIGRLVHLDQVNVSYRLNNLKVDYEGNGPEFVVKWNPVYPIIASYTGDGLYLWDVFGLNVIEPDNTFRDSGLGGFHTISWHPSGEYLAQAGKDGAYVNIWRITMEDLINAQP